MSSRTDRQTNTDHAPRVSVIVTTYDRSQLAKRAIKSTLSQTYENIEIIVVEDGSDTDIETWIRNQNSDIIYINHGESRGLAAARNTGLCESSGKYVAYLDDDDEWKPEKIEQQVAYFESERHQTTNDIGVVYCGIEDRFDYESRTATRMPQNDGPLAAEIRENGAKTLSSTYIFRRSALEVVGGFDETLPSSIDHDIWMELATNGYAARALAEPLTIKHHRPAADELTNDTEKRITGVRAYLEKWQPTYRDWYGTAAGDRFTEQYFADVVGRLAIKKLVTIELSDAVRATVAVFQFSNQPLYNCKTLARHLYFVGGSIVLPRPIKRVLRSVLH